MMDTDRGNDAGDASPTPPESAVGAAAIEPEAEVINLAAHADDIPEIRIYSRDQLDAMGIKELCFHTAKLQQAFEMVTKENGYLNWEFNELQNNIAFFSRALKLAHQLNVPDLDQIAALTVSELPAYFDCAFAALYLYDDQSRLYSLCRSSAPVPEAEPLSREDHAGHFLVKCFSELIEPTVITYDRWRSAVFSDVGETLATVMPDAWADLLANKAIVFPLRVKSADAGYVDLGGLIVGNSKSNLDVKHAEASVVFADFLSSSLFNAKLVRTLNDMAIHDPLTGLFNRRHLCSRLEEIINESVRHSRPLSLAMLDIDYFKRFNDTYGHLCGDEVLREVAACVRSAARVSGGDIVARYGGEEFVIVMPGAGLTVAANISERIHAAIKGLAIRFEGKELAVRASLGVTQFKPGDTLQSFIDRADAALYQAKDEGRDRVCTV